MIQEAVSDFQKALAAAPGTQQIQADLMLARKKARDQSKDVAKPKPSGKKIEVLDTSSDEEEIPATQPTGYKKIVIDEDSDSEDDAAGDRAAQSTEDEDSRAAKAAQGTFKK